jgi:hypothetical protein
MELIIKAPLILDFDIENRPLSYLGMDFTTSEITAIAAGFTHEEEVDVFLLTADAMTTDKLYRERMTELLEGFRAEYDHADIVTGHFIRNHDLPIINGALVELGRKPLEPKLTVCTKNDLVRFKGISKSQESLGLMLAHFNKKAKFLKAKEHMGQDDWRRGNRLTHEGVEETKRRVVGDVKQHKELRLALVKAGLLKSPKVWRP